MSKERLEAAAKKDALFSLVDDYGKQEPILMVKHFHMMLALECIRILREDNRALLEELETLREIIRKYQSTPVSA